MILTTLVPLKHNKKVGEKALIITDSCTCLKYENRSFGYFGGVIGKASTASNNKTFPADKRHPGSEGGWVNVCGDVDQPVERYPPHETVGHSARGGLHHHPLAAQGM